MNQLSHRSFSSALVRIGAVGDVAVEILRDRDFRGERTPVFRDLDIFLFENDLAAVVSDFRVATFPFNLIEWRYSGIAEHAFKTEARYFSSFPSCFFGVRSSAAVYLVKPVEFQV